MGGAGGCAGAHPGPDTAGEPDGGGAAGLTRSGGVKKERGRRAVNGGVIGEVYALPGIFSRHPYGAAALPECHNQTEPPAARRRIEK